jgi:hypothetical protein
MASDIVLEPNQVAIEPKLEIRCDSSVNGLQLDGNAEMGRLDARSVVVGGPVLARSLTIQKSVQMFLPTGDGGTPRQDDLSSTIGWILERLDAIEAQLGIQSPEAPDRRLG